MHGYKAMNELDKVLRTDRRESLTFPDEYSVHCKNFIFMLTQIESMWVGHWFDLGLIKAERHRIEFKKTDYRPTDASPYLAGPMAQDFKGHDISRMLTMGLSRRPKRNGPHRLFSSLKRMKPFTFA